MNNKQRYEVWIDGCRYMTKTAECPPEVEVREVVEWVTVDRDELRSEIKYSGGGAGVGIKIYHKDEKIGYIHTEVGLKISHPDYRMAPGCGYLSVFEIQKRSC